MDAKQLRNTLLLVLTALIWGCAFVAQSVGAEYVGAFTFLAVRSWLGCIVLLPVIAVIGKIRQKKEATRDSEAKKAELKLLIKGGIWCGIFLFTASYAQQKGLETTTTAKAGFITTMYVVLVPLVSIFLGKKTGKKIWACVALGVVGLYLLCMKGSLRLSPGDTMVLICAFLYTGQILAVDHFAPQMDGIKLSWVEFFVTAVLASVCMFIFEAPRLENIMAAGLPLLYAGVMSTGVAYTLQVIGQKDLNPTVASIAMCLESVFSALAGWVLLGQGLTARELTGCILMFAAIVLAQLPDKVKK